MDEDGNGSILSRTYGTSPDPHDTTTNKVITQAGGTNYPSMVADIEDNGPATVRYIHLTAGEDVRIYEIMCWENKRIYPSEIVLSGDRPHIGDVNGPYRGRTIESFLLNKSINPTIELNFASPTKITRIFYQSDYENTGEQVIEYFSGAAPPFVSIQLYE